MIFGQKETRPLMPSTPANHLIPLALADRLLQKAGVPAAWGVTAAQFQSLVERSAAQRFSGVSPDALTAETFAESLHAKDLALATACAAGNSAAWDFFVSQYRQEMVRAARAIAGNAAGRELADSMYADLYGGMRGTQSGERKSPFEYFLGRSKLSTWLHAVLSRKHVDEIRRTRKLDSLDEPHAGDGDGDSRARIEIPAEKTGTLAGHEPDRDRYLALLQSVIAGVLAALPGRDRLRLAYYYVDELTLAQIGKILGEHEATVSRKLERTRREIREQVDFVLRAEKNLDEAQRSLCYEYARDEWPFDLTGVLAGKAP